MIALLANNLRAEDDIIVYGVMVEAVNRLWWQRYKCDLEERFHQEEFLIPSHRYESHSLTFASGPCVSFADTIEVVSQFLYQSCDGMTAIESSNRDGGDGENFLI